MSSDKAAVSAGTLKYADGNLLFDVGEDAARGNLVAKHEEAWKSWRKAGREAEAGKELHAAFKESIHRTDRPAIFTSDVVKGDPHLREEWRKFLRTSDDPAVAEARQNARAARRAITEYDTARLEAQKAVLGDSEALKEVEGLGELDEAGRAQAIDNLKATVDKNLEGLQAKKAPAVDKKAEAKAKLNARSAELNKRDFFSRNAAAIGDNLKGENWKGWSSLKPLARLGGAGAGGSIAFSGLGKMFSPDEDTGESRTGSGVLQTAAGAMIALAALRLGSRSNVGVTHGKAQEILKGIEGGASKSV